MTKGRIFFLVLAAVTAISALVLMGFAHIDMAEMRTVRSPINFDGIVAFICGFLIACGLVVLFPLWRIFAYDPTLAGRDLNVWTWALVVLLLGLHLPYAMSLSIDEWVNAEALETPAQVLKDFWISSEDIFLMILLLWPVVAIACLWAYRNTFAPSLGKAK